MPTPSKRARAVFPGGSLGEYDLPPGLGLVLSLAHTEADIARLLEIARATLREDGR